MSPRRWAITVALIAAAAIPMVLVRHSTREEKHLREEASAPSQRISPAPPAAGAPPTLGAAVPLPKALSRLHALLEGGAWDEELLLPLMDLENWIAAASAEELSSLLNRTVDPAVPVRERGLVALALSASNETSVKRFIIDHLLGQGDFAVAFAYSLALKSQRITLSYEDRQGFWRGAFLVPTLSDLIAPDFVRQFHAQRLNLVDLSEVPEEALQESIQVGNVFVRQLIKPLEKGAQLALLDYVERGSAVKAAQEMVFLLPWDETLSALAIKIYENPERDAGLRRGLLTAFIQSTGPGIESRLLGWAATERDPAFIQVIATGLCSRGATSARKAEIVAAFENMLLVQSLDRATVSHLATHLALLNSSQSVEVLARLSGTGATPDVQLGCIKALGSNTGSPTTVPARTEALLTWINGADPNKRLEAGYALYNLAAIAAKDRGTVEKAITALQGLRDSLSEKKDQLAFDVLLVALRSKLR